MPGSLDWKVNDMSVARMVTFVRSGLSTRVNCGVSAEVACTTLDRSTVTAVFGVVVRQTGSMFAAKVCGGRMVKYTVEVPAVGDLQPHRCTAFAHRTGVEHEFAVRACGDRRLVGVLHTGADQGERIAVWVDEAAKRVHGVRGTLFDLGFLRLLLAGWCAVLVAGNRQRHGRP